MNIVSFSLWGPREHYYRGVFLNHERIRRLLPSFGMVVFVDADYPNDRVLSIRREGIEVIREVSLGAFHGLFWRFFAFEWPGVTLVRDLDSRITDREVGLVNEWIESGKKFHIIRDHRCHVRPIGGGMCGCRGGLPGLRSMVSKFGSFGQYADDEQFLQELVFPLIKDDCLEHTSNGHAATSNFRKVEKATDGTYIGLRHDEHDIPFGEA